MCYISADKDLKFNWEDVQEIMKLCLNKGNIKE